MEYFYATGYCTCVSIIVRNLSQLFFTFVVLYLPILFNISIRDNIIIIIKHFSSWYFKFSQSQKIPTFEAETKSFPKLSPPPSKFYSLINSRSPFIEHRDHGNSHFKRKLCTLENPGFAVRASPFDRAAHLKVKCPCWNGNFLPFCAPPRSALRSRARRIREPRCSSTFFPAFPSIRLDMQIISWKKSSDRCGEHGRYN